MSNIRSDKAVLAISSASLALLCLAYGDGPGSGSLSNWIPHHALFDGGLALILLGASIGLCWGRAAIPSVLAIGAYDAIWILLSTPSVFSHPLSIGAWYPFCEGLTAFVAPCILFMVVRSDSNPLSFTTTGTRILRTAQIAFGLTCIFYGLSHFAYADYTASMVPSWLPYPLELAYLTGLAHVAAGLGIITGILARLAALLETMMMSLFGLLVWVPTFFMQPPPKWATPPHTQWSELVINIVLAASAWVVAVSLKDRQSRKKQLRSIFTRYLR